MAESGNLRREVCSAPAVEPAAPAKGSPDMHTCMVHVECRCKINVRWAVNCIRKRVRSTLGLSEERACSCWLLALLGAVSPIRLAASGQRDSVGVDTWQCDAFQHTLFCAVLLLLLCDLCRNVIVDCSGRQGMLRRLPLRLAAGCFRHPSARPAYLQSRSTPSACSQCEAGVQIRSASCGRTGVRIDRCLRVRRTTVHAQQPPMACMVVLRVGRTAPSIASSD